MVLRTAVLNEFDFMQENVEYWQIMVEHSCRLYRSSIGTSYESN